MMWYWGNGGLHWWGWMLGVAGTIVFWGVVIWLVVNIVRWGFPSRSLDGRSVGEAETPESILRRRFAAGEIDEDEFHRRLGVLRGHERTGAG